MKELTSHQREWHGLYDGNYDLWIPDAYSHPAKMGVGLCFKIMEHLKELGLLTSGATILDPMGGIGTTCMVATAKGYPSIMVELEEKFVTLSQANAERMASKGFTAPIKIIQGDSRNLSQLLQERGLVGIVSPPYGDTAHKPGNLPEMRAKLEELYPGHVGEHTCLNATEYSNNPSNIGNLRDVPLKQSQAQGQIGQEQGETYLSAMRQVYSEIAKVAHVLVVVIKNPTRNKKLRRLDLDTISLLEATGWRILCHHHAILFEEQELQDLFGETKKKVKGRMSFFKRLSWQKGSPVARWEDILVAVREGEGMVSVMSPPYEDQQFAQDKEFYQKKCLQTGRAIDTPHQRQYGEAFYGSTPGQIGKLK